MKAKLKKDLFIQWYFLGVNYADIGEELYNELKNKGEFNLSAQFLLDNCGTVPSYLTIGGSEQGEISTDDIILI